MVLTQMSEHDLEALVERIVEQKLLELLGDPEADWPLKESLRERLLAQQEAVKRGERGTPLDEAVRGLEGP